LVLSDKEVVTTLCSELNAAMDALDDIVSLGRGIPDKPAYPGKCEISSSCCG